MNHLGLGNRLRCPHSCGELQMFRFPRGTAFGALAFVGLTALTAAFLGAPPASSTVSSTSVAGSRIVLTEGTNQEPFRYHAVQIGSRGTRTVPLPPGLGFELSFAPRGDSFVYNAGTPQRDETIFLTPFGAKTSRCIALARVRCGPAGGLQMERPSSRSPLRTAAPASSSCKPRRGDAAT